MTQDRKFSTSLIRELAAVPQSGSTKLDSDVVQKGKERIQRDLDGITTFLLTDLEIEAIGKIYSSLEREVTLRTNKEAGNQIEFQANWNFLANASIEVIHRQDTEHTHAFTNIEITHTFESARMVLSITRDQDRGILSRELRLFPKLGKRNKTCLVFSLNPERTVASATLEGNNAEIAQRQIQQIFGQIDFEKLAEDKEYANEISWKFRDKLFGIEHQHVA